ncbi:hypothetical protein PHMEG_0006164 [Phytophthora megakarya]|uniref:Uncharacterized protein n=1 Tax=Phytophthora megakarya TaxID=4795 RepID=A0A225WPJ2_9STRA|nr:hypothetical protein PHMEG_0006164 [Phytophthora megakarya]
MLNLIPIDEKWFNHDKKTRLYFMLPDEEPPQRHLKSARHVEKTIFWQLSWDPHNKTRFDGKIGLWPFAEDYVAQRSSKNSPAGTELMRNIKVVDTNVYKHFLIDYPPNSPDLNCLDLGYFAAIQSLQYRTYVKTTMELIGVVQASFEELDNDTLDNICITLQQVMECLLKCEGGNEYKLPHMGKAKLRREGRFPIRLS